MIAYKHENNANNGQLELTTIEGTFAVNLPTITQLTELVLQSKQYLDVYLGHSQRHPKDNFNKRVGREEATKNISLVKMKLVDVLVEKQPNRTEYWFYGYVPNRSHYPEHLRSLPIKVAFSIKQPHKSGYTPEVRLEAAFFVS